MPACSRRSCSVSFPDEIFELVIAKLPYHRSLNQMLLLSKSLLPFTRRGVVAATESFVRDSPFLCRDFQEIHDHATLVEWYVYHEATGRCVEMARCKEFVEDVLPYNFLCEVRRFFGWGTVVPTGTSRCWESLDSIEGGVMVRATFRTPDPLVQMVLSGFVSNEISVFINDLDETLSQDADNVRTTFTGHIRAYVESVRWTRCFVHVSSTR